MNLDSGQHYLAFSKDWFIKQQSRLLWLLNNKYTRRWFRWVLHIYNTDDLIEIHPHAYVVSVGNGLQLHTRTHPKYGKRLYYAFRPLWWLLHAWDAIIADRFIPQLSFGLTTLTVYPDGGNPGTTSMDGTIVKSNAVWATAHDAASGDTATQADTANSHASNSFIAATYLIRRGFFLFDTSALTSTAIISAAILSFAAQGSVANDDDVTSTNIVSSTPASSTVLATSDFSQVGTTVFATKLNSAWNSTNGTYNDFTLDANGIANISKTGISKFATRNSLDVTNVAPGVGNSDSISTYMADQTGTATDPKLVITYTLASVSPSTSPSISASPSVSPSVSASPSASKSPSASPSVSPSVSVSPSASPSVPVSSPSASISPSVSKSPSISPSSSVSPSVSPSVSVSPSISVSPSVSPSRSLSPSISPSVSVSPSISPSSSVSPSPSPTPYVFPTKHSNTWTMQSEH